MKKKLKILIILYIFTAFNVQGSQEGIHARELLQRRKDRAPRKYKVNTVHPELSSSNVIPGLYELREVKKDKGPIINIAKRSYLNFSAGIFQPASTSFAYVEKEPFYQWGVGYQRNQKIAFDFRKTTYKSRGNGAFFGVPESSYNLEITPLSASVKFSPLIYKRLIPYSGIGFSRIEIVHTLNEPGRTSSEVKEIKYSPFAFYGLEYYEREDFSVFFEVAKNFSGEASLNIKNKIYKVDYKNYIWSFGIKFYFE
ncbi:MAG: hypothetical protein ACQESP_03950 [Candidatus Muiribacteriota bacterium]